MNMESLLNIVAIYFLICFFSAIIITCDIGHFGLYIAQGTVTKKLTKVILAIMLATLACPWLLYVRFRIFFKLVFTSIP